MKMVNKNFGWLIACLALVFTSFNSYAANPLLNVQTGYPDIFINSVVDQGADYDGSQLTITSTPLTVTFSAGAIPGFVTGGVMEITIGIDASGVATAGTFVMTGIVTDPGTAIPYASPLLTGTVDNYGIADFGPTDRIELAMTVAGGSLAGILGTVDLGAIIALEGSEFTGDFLAPWAASVAKGNIGPIPDAPTGSGCSRTIGYWKTHAEEWPVDSVNLGGNTYSKSLALQILDTAVKGDKSLIMAKQLIATKLNLAGGSDSSCIADVVGASDTWVGEHGIGSRQRQWDGGDVLKDDLDAYNNGQLCVLHCE